MSSNLKSTDAEQDEASAATVYTPAPNPKPPAASPPSESEIATVYTPRSPAKPAPVVPQPGVSAAPSADDDNSTMHVNSRPQVARGQRTSRPWPILVVVVVVGIAAAALTQVLPGETVPKQTRPAAPTQADRTAALLAEGRQAFANQQYTAAAATFQAVVNIDPANAEAKAGMDKAKAADAAQPILVQAQKQLAAKQYAEARTTLRQIASDSPVAAPARALWTLVDTEEATALLAQGLEQVKQGRRAEAKATLVKLKPLDDRGSAKLAAAIDDSEGGNPKR